MSGVLMLNAQNLPKFTDPMVVAARGVLKAESVNWGEVQVPNPTDMPTALVHYLDTGHYSGILAVGCIEKPEDDIGQSVIYGELIHQLLEFSTYYSFPLGLAVCLINKKTKVTDAVEFTKSASTSAAMMVNNIIRLNSFESEIYVPSSRHN